MSSVLDSSKQEMLALIRRFQKQKFQPPMMPEGITPSEASVVMTVFMAKEQGAGSIHPRQVAEWLHLTPSALSQTLKVLDEKDLIKRHRSSNDSRVVSLELSKQGLEIAEEMARRHDHFIDDLVTYVGVEDMGHLLRVLNKVVDFVSEQTSDGILQTEDAAFCGHRHLHYPPKKYFDGKDKKDTSGE